MANLQKRKKCHQSYWISWMVKTSSLALYLYTIQTRFWRVFVDVKRKFLAETCVATVYTKYLKKSWKLVSSLETSRFCLYFANSCFPINPQLSHYLHWYRSRLYLTILYLKYKLSNQETAFVPRDNVIFTVFHLKFMISQCSARYNISWFYFA